MIVFSYAWLRYRLVELAVAFIIMASALYVTDYIQQRSRAGRKVAICDQAEPAHDPAGVDRIGQPHPVLDPAGRSRSREGRQRPEDRR